MEQGYMTPISGRRRRGVGGWWDGEDTWGGSIADAVTGADATALMRNNYVSGRNRGLLMGAGAVGAVWAVFAAWYFWKK